MKRLLFLFIGVLMGGSVCFGQSEEELFRDILTKSLDIVYNLGDYDTSRVNLHGDNTVDGLATGFSLAGDLRLIRVVYYGEEGNDEADYFFHEGSLIMSNCTYDVKPVDMEENDPPRLETGTIRKEQCFFHDGKMLYCLDAHGERIQEPVAEALMTAQGLIAHAHKMRDLLGE